jgi:uncharacterized protein YkwD
MIRFLLRKRTLFLIAGFFGLASAAFLTAGCGPEVEAELETYPGINAIRVQNGLPALTPDRQLVEVARIRAQDMAAKGYFSHEPPDGCNFVCLMDNRGVGRAWAGENLAWNNWPWEETAKKAVEMWGNSPPHLENILNCRYTRFGTGVAKAADGRVYYAMIFEGNAQC